MNRKLSTWIWTSIYLLVGLSIMHLVNGFSNAKWFDGGMDLIYGIITIFLSVLLYYSYKCSKNKNIYYVSLGFFIVVVDRIFQILLQEIHLKTSYTLTILPLSWALSDLFMVLGFLFVVKGLWGIKHV